MSSAPVLKLYYFEARGRAEIVRLTLAGGGKSFEDIRLTRDQWAKMKSNGEAPFGQMPFIEYNGKKHGESKAIASFVARLSGMAGKTPEEGMRVDEVYCLTTDLLDQMARTHYEPDPARKEEMETKLAKELIPKYLGFFERLLEDDSGFYVARALSMADLAVYDITDTVLKRSATALDQCPRIQKMRAKVEKDPAVKAYLASRPVTQF